MGHIILAYDQEFLVDVYVYAAKNEQISMGSYELLCNSTKIDLNVVRFAKNDSDISCIYMSTLQRAFLKAADFAGKYAVPLVDPDKNILVKKGDRVTPIKKKIAARFIFRFHIPEDRVMQIIKGTVPAMTVQEEKWRNLFKLMRMQMSKPNLPYRNIRVDVNYEFVKCAPAEISEISELADKELVYMHNSYQVKHESR